MAPKDSHFQVFTPSYPEVRPGLIDSFLKIEYGRNDGMSFPKSSDKKSGTSVLGLGSLSQPPLESLTLGEASCHVVRQLYAEAHVTGNEALKIPCK